MLRPFMCSKKEITKILFNSSHRLSSRSNKCHLNMKHQLTNNGQQKMCRTKYVATVTYRTTDRF